MFSSVPAGSGTSSSSRDDARGELARRLEAEAAAEAEVHLARVGLLGDRDAGNPSTSASSAAATVPE